MDAFMQAALEQAHQGLQEGGIPIGAALVAGGQIVSRGRNRRCQQGSAILHAEMDALERAGRRPASFYAGATLYTTLSPCSMCAGAVLLYGIPQIVIGENRNFCGEERLLRARGIGVEVLDAADCINLMADFIAAQPQLWHEDISRDPPLG